MGRILKFGCVGIIGLIVLVVLVVVLSPKSQQTVTGQAASKPGGGAAELPTVGQTASKGGWELTLNDYGPYDRFALRPASTPAQGQLVVVDFTAKNTQTRTSNFTTNDFSIEAGDKRKFAPSGQTATIDRGFMVTQQVQPGLTTDNRVVFDIDPAAADLTLHALGMDFRLP